MVDPVTGEVVMTPELRAKLLEFAALQAELAKLTGIEKPTQVGKLAVEVAEDVTKEAHIASIKDSIVNGLQDAFPGTLQDRVVTVSRTMGKQQDGTVIVANLLVRVQVPSAEVALRDAMPGIAPGESFEATWNGDSWTVTPGKAPRTGTAPKPGTGKGRGKGKRVSVDNLEYTSASAACEALGIDTKGSSAIVVLTGTKQVLTGTTYTHNGHQVTVLG